MKEAGWPWVNEMFDSQDSRSHDPDMDWVFERHNYTAATIGVCEVDYKMYYAYLMRSYLCMGRIRWIEADFCHVETEWQSEQRQSSSNLKFRSFRGLFFLTFLSTLFMFIASCVLWWCSTRRGDETDEEVGRGEMHTPQFEEPAMPRRYHYGELAAATSNFAKSLKRRFRVLCVGKQPRTVSTLYRRDHTITIVYDTYTLHDR
jgi:hypothetical protein